MPYCPSNSMAKLTISSTTRLETLRKQMALHSIDAYYIPGEDAHQSEYISECDSRRAYISGFTGSAGSAVVTMTEAALWTDGRYFLQAERQLDQNWTLMKSGLPNTPSKEDWILKKVKTPKFVLSFDSSLVSFDLMVMWKKYFADHNSPITIMPAETNLVDVIWEDRPPRPSNPVMELSLNFCGQSFKDKLASIRTIVEENKCQGLVISSLDEIAWILNWRGSDIPFNPVFYSYLWITSDAVYLYMNEKDRQINDLVKSMRPELLLRSYSSVFSDLTQWRDFSSPTDRLLLTQGIASVALVLSAGGLDKIKLLPSIVAPIKAVKNETEIEGFRKCHIQDGIALVCFFSWLERELAEKSFIDEIIAADKLQKFRSEGENFVDLSFDTISSSGPNSAIIHYKPTKSSSRALSLDEVYLCDSGGQYLYFPIAFNFRTGTTDVTRTMHFGDPSSEVKRAFTLVLKGNLALGNIVFPEKTTGLHLDVLARQFLWNCGMDYRHGTGHGVGHFLNVHEGPQGIGLHESYLKSHLKEGMVVTNEPGFYKDNFFGIRIENVMIIRKKTNFHQPTFGDVTFLEFETITMCPIQKKLIDVSLLTANEIELINTYHVQVYNSLAPLLKEKYPVAFEWLRKETSPILL